MDAQHSAAAAAGAAASNMGQAFALSAIAGFCVLIGASVVFSLSMRHVKLLWASLALAALMMIISFTEVMTQNETDFDKRGYGQGTTLQLSFTYLAILAGVALCHALDPWVADFIMRLAAKFAQYRHSRTLSQRSCPNCLPDVEMCDRPGKKSSRPCPHPAPDCQGPCKLVPRAPEPAGTYNSDVEEAGSVQTALIDTSRTPGVSSASPQLEPPFTGDRGESLWSLADTTGVEAHDRHLFPATELLTDEDSTHLVRVSITVWLALTVHNIPEGLATFVGYMSSPHLGMTDAVLSASHNIAEGIALGVPIFFATGSKWKAVAWAAASGVFQPIGALLGMAVHPSGHLHPVVSCFIMAVVAGVMAGMLLRELLPRVPAGDPTRRHLLVELYGGMAFTCFLHVLLNEW